MTYTRASQNLIILDSFGELTYKQKRELLDGFNQSEPNFKKFTQNLIKSGKDGVYNMVEGKFNDPSYRAKILSALEAEKIKVITYFSSEYPAKLKQIPSPPIALYCKGNTGLLANKLFGIVGSRHTPTAAMRFCSQISEQIAEKFTVVSGLADGADSAAVTGALEKKNVISVLAYGFNHVYPALNQSLLNKLYSNALVITEHRPEIEPRSYLFPPRNRLIAALSCGVLVTSAGEKSGALITADYAKQYLKDVFAFPYSLGVAYGVGCNKLIKEGAKLVERAEDVLEFYGYTVSKQAEVALTDEQRAVLEVIEELGEAHVQQISDRLSKPAFLLIPSLTTLEMSGKIIKLGGNRYTLH